MQLQEKCSWTLISTARDASQFPSRCGFTSAMLAIDFILSGFFFFFLLFYSGLTVWEVSRFRTSQRVSSKRHQVRCTWRFQGGGVAAESEGSGFDCAVELDSDEKVPMVGCSRDTCKARVGPIGDVRCCFSLNCDSIAGHWHAKTSLCWRMGGTDEEVVEPTRGHFSSLICRRG
jgi:hypothetical protein